MYGAGSPAVAQYHGLMSWNQFAIACKTIQVSDGSSRAIVVAPYRAVRAPGWRSAYTPMMSRNTANDPHAAASQRQRSRRAKTAKAAARRGASRRLPVYE